MRRSLGEGRVLAATVPIGLLTGVGLFALTSAAATVLIGPGAAGGVEGGSEAWLGLAMLGLVPATVVAGWTAIILHYRSHPRWLRLAAAAGLLGAAVSVTFAAILVGPIGDLQVGGASVADIEMMSPGGGVWIVKNLVELLGVLSMLAPAAAAGLVRGRRTTAPRSRGWHLSAGLAWLVTTVLAYSCVLELALTQAR